MGVHPEPWSGVDLHDPAAHLADRLADVGAQEVDPRDVQAHHPRRELRDLRVLRVDLLGAVDADPARAHVAGALEVDPLSARRDIGHGESLLAEVRRRLRIDLDPRQHFFVTDAAAWIRVGGLDQLADGVLAIALDVGGHALRDGPQLTADDQAPIVVALQEALHHHAAVAALCPRSGVPRSHRGLVREVEHHPAPMVAVNRLHRHRVADAGRRSGSLILAAHHLGARDGDAGRLQQAIGELLVRGDVDAQRAGLAGHRGPDPLLVYPVAQLHQ